MIVEHVRHAVLRAAQDEAHNSQIDRGIFCDLMFVVLKTVDRNENENVAKYPQKEQTEIAVARLHFADRNGLFSKIGCARQPDNDRDAACTDQIADPYERQRCRICPVILKRIANFAGEQVKPASADHE